MLAQSLKPATDPNLSAAIPALSLVKSERLPIHLSTQPAADREDFPLVKYWYRHEWNAAENSQVAQIGTQGKSRAANGENVSLKFIEDENGNIIDGFKATAMRRFARELWAGLNSIGKAPKTWGKVDAAVAAQYRNEMEQKFPELRLGDNHWKADLIATLNYPSWYNNNVEKEEQSKRASVDPLPEAKRLRTSTDAPLPPSIPHKKRSKHHTRDAIKEVNFQYLRYSAIIYLQSSQNLLSMAGPEASNDANHPSMQSDLPVSAIVSSRDPDTRPRPRVSCIFITTT
jgi:hypothetical protein